MCAQPTIEYHSLAKGRPGVKHLTNLPKRGGGHCHKIIAMCIERATMLRANTTHVMCEYKAGEGVSCCSRLIN